MAEMVFAYAGSFNPPHVGHMACIKEMLNMGADRIHLFVRVNPELDLVDPATKRRWFEKMIEDNWPSQKDRIVIHMVESEKVTGKHYSLRTERDALDKLDETAGEHITHFTAGEDYRKIWWIWKILVPETKLIITGRAAGISSSEFRKDPEGMKFLVAPYVYEDIKKAAQQRERRDLA